MIFNIPDNEILWVRYMNDGAVTHLITSDTHRTEYYLYTVKNNKAKRIKYKSAEPTDLYEKIRN